MTYPTLILLIATIASAIPLPYKHDNGALRYITLEEHVFPTAEASSLVSNPILQLLVNGSFGPSLVSDLLDAGAGRLDDMNRNNIQMQIVSNANLDQDNVTAARISNDAVNQAFISAHSDRFAAFCALAMASPDDAAQELERCVTEFGFVGGLANANLPNGTFFDSPAYWSVFAAAERLNVPFYLHPGFPPTSHILPTGGAFAPAIGPDGNKTFNDYVAVTLASESWGFEASAGLAFLRLYAAGLFDEYPNLKIILGHVGEMVPYILSRSDEFLSPLTAPRKSLAQVWTENVWITTSGYFSLDPIPTLLSNTAAERIMYSVDTPFNRNYQGSLFMEKLRKSRLVTPTEFEGIAYGNAQRLFGLK